MLLALPRCHVLVSTWTLTAMTAVHLYRLVVDYMGWNLDISGPMMLLVIKLMGLGFQLHDGTVMARRYEAELATGSKREAVLKERQRDAVTQVPDPLAYFAWVFSISSFLTGPNPDFKEYVATCEETHFTSRDTAGRVHVNRRWGERLKYGGLKLLVALALLGLNTVGTAAFPFDALYKDPQLMYGTSWAYRCFYAYIALAVLRCKYYFAWTMAEGAANVAGFGYVPPSGKGEGARKSHWGGIANLDILHFEFPSNIGSATHAWNKRTQSWLSRYAGKRVPRAYAQITAFSLSAFWHGFYPGYYLFFLCAPIAMSVATALKDKVRARLYPRVPEGAKPPAGYPNTAARVYDYVGRVCTTLALNYLVIPFVALGWDEGFRAWASLYYAGHIALALLWLVLQLVPKPRAPATDAAATHKKTDGDAAAAEVSKEVAAAPDAGKSKKK